MHTGSDECTEAIGSADRDWHNQSAFLLAYGDVNSDVPLIDGCGLYLASSWRDGDYIKSYNKTILDHINKDGLPHWAPGARVVPNSELASLLEESSSVQEFTSACKDVRRLFRNQMQMWDCAFGSPPERFVFLPDRNIILLVGQMNGILLVDQLDLIFLTWMARSYINSPGQNSKY